MKDLGLIKVCPECNHSISYVHEDVKCTVSDIYYVVKQKFLHKYWKKYPPMEKKVHTMEELVEFINSRPSELIGYISKRQLFKDFYIECPHCGKKIMLDTEDVEVHLT